ncbi:MFS transporter [Nocardia colli]|uniref:MFS transporter n=1 Tax=Nocardia colli TaxID=2545717 RepID=A0A5N0DX03_9NOCA|nr:MFS transporter [Nocardia colli]KAA8880599.1 MFS transporter [Nocardia colli]
MNQARAPIPLTADDNLSKPTRRAMFGLGLGNTLEWYDWQIFGLLAAFIGPSFFADRDPVSSTLDALAVFAVGFVARPLGGIVLGTIADRVGRRRVMLVSIGAMAGTTAVVGLLPTYSQLGVWAGVGLVACRIVQGLSTGVEAPLSTVYAVELMPQGQEGRAAGFIGFFVNFGIFSASLVSFCTSLLIGGDAMSTWGWRAPVLVGALMGFVVLYLRRSLPESLKEHEVITNTRAVWGEVRSHWLGVVAIVFVVGTAQAFNYAWIVGLPSLARSRGADPTAVFAITSTLGVMMLVGSLLTGRWADRVRLSRAFVIARTLAIPTAFIALVYDSPDLGMFAVVLLGGGVILILNMTLYNVVSTSLMPKSCRAAGTGLGYGIGVACFGGTASYLVVWLDKHEVSWLFAAYIAVLSILSIVTYLLARTYSGTFAGK